MNGKICDEFLNEHWFTTLAEVQRLAAEWLHDYNHVRPHSSLNYEKSMQFRKRQEAGCRLRTLGGHAPSLLLPKPSGAILRPDSTSSWYMVGRSS